MQQSPFHYDFFVCRNRDVENPGSMNKVKSNARGVRKWTPPHERQGKNKSQKADAAEFYDAIMHDGKEFKAVITVDNGGTPFIVFLVQLGVSNEEMWWNIQELLQSLSGPGTAYVFKLDSTIADSVIEND